MDINELIARRKNDLKEIEKLYSSFPTNQKILFFLIVGFLKLFIIDLEELNMKKD